MSPVFPRGQSINHLIVRLDARSMLNTVNQPTRRKRAMKNSMKKKTLLKALVVSDERQHSWFLNGCFHEANDLMDVRALRVNMRDFHSILREIVQQTPDVLLLDSTLSSPFVARMAVYVRDKMPNLPIFTLPDIHGALIRDTETRNTANGNVANGDQ